MKAHLSTIGKKLVVESKVLMVVFPLITNFSLVIRLYVSSTLILTECGFIVCLIFIFDI